MLSIWRQSKWIRRAATIGCLLAGLAAQPYRPVIFMGESMKPTYENGSLAIGVHPNRELRRGDIVVLNTPEGRIVKRVALIGGDVMQQVHMGAGWMDNLTTRWVPASTRRIQTRMVPIPKGYIYVLGDNAGNSKDSRELGVLPEAWVSEILLNPKPKAEGLSIARKSQNDLLVSLRGVPGKLSRKDSTLQHL